MPVRAYAVVMFSVIFLIYIASFLFTNYNSVFHNCLLVLFDDYVCTLHVHEVNQHSYDVKLFDQAFSSVLTVSKGEDFTTG